MPNAICVCEDNRKVCASDDKTYNSICDLNLNKVKHGLTDDKITVKNFGPCSSGIQTNVFFLINVKLFSYLVPKFTVKPLNITTTLNSYIVLSCEVHGHPIPEISWDFIPYPDKGAKIKLPSDVLDVAVQTRGGPDLYMVTSWIQILHLRKTDAGIYNCIASNEIGNNTASAIVAVKESVH